MKRWIVGFLASLFFFSGSILAFGQTTGADKKGVYLLPGDMKEGWKVFTVKKCSTCHAIWGEGGKEGPDLGSLPESYVSQTQLAALMWNHWPEMSGKMEARKISPPKMDKKEMADLFAFLNFLRYMDEPGNPQNGKRLTETKHCNKCHPILKEGGKGDLSPWGMYMNPILWAQMMWKHALQMEREMKKKGLPPVEFKGNEMVDIIAYIRSLSSKMDKVYLSPGNPESGKRLFTQKGCFQCHSPQGELDLSKKKDFPRTLAQFAGMMWNHSYKMWKAMEERGMERPTLSPQEMADLVAYLFSTHYFDEPGDPVRGKNVFIKKQCNLCHAKGTKMPNLSVLKSQISPIFMAQAMWNHGAEMLEKMRKAGVPWRKVDGKEMADLMEYLNRGTP
jgi:mono/diheme cytochrome c family protein